MTPDTPTPVAPSANAAQSPATDMANDSDTARISFSVRSKKQEYGDGKSFHKYLIVMRADGKIVGVEDEPSRIHATRSDCRAAGYQRVRQLRSHRLFIVDVSKNDIELGEARSCRACAISQALYRNQERIGLSQWEFDFRVEPYGFAVDCDGIVLENTSDGTSISTGENNMPDLVLIFRGRMYVESMYEWTVRWDEWAESRSMSAKEWREGHPDDGGKPSRPLPCSFVLNLSEMQKDQV